MKSLQLLELVLGRKQGRGFRSSRGQRLLQVLAECRHACLPNRRRHSPTSLATDYTAQRLALQRSPESLDFKEKVDPFPEETTGVGVGEGGSQGPSADFSFSD